MSLFNFNQEELLSFFAVLVRYSVLMAVLPIVGDRFVPQQVKILLAMVISITLFPSLVSRGLIHPGEALRWGATVGGITTTVFLEVFYGLVLGFTARMAFEAVSFGGNLMGNFMGFAMASTFDPQEQSQTQIVAEIQMALATLVFLVLDGHHLMLRASLDSYRIVGLGGTGMGSLVGPGAINAALAQRLISLSGEVIRFGIQLAAPVAVTLFTVNVAFGVMAKAMPQLNILVLSISVSAMVGLMVMFLSVAEYQGAVSEHFSHIHDWMGSVLKAIATGK